MPAGIQTWNVNGAMTLDLTERLTLVMGTAYANGNNGNQYIGPLPAGNFWALAYPTRDNLTGFYTIPEVSYSGDYVRWVYDQQGGSIGNTPANIIFGIY